MFAIILLASVALMALIYFFLPPVGICDCSERELQPELETERETDNDIKSAETELSVRWDDTETEIMGEDTACETDMETTVDDDFVNQEINPESRPTESYVTTDDMNEIQLISGPSRE